MLRTVWLSTEQEDHGRSAALAAFAATTQRVGLLQELNSLPESVATTKRRCAICLRPF